MSAPVSARVTDSVLDDAPPLPSQRLLVEVPPHYDLARVVTMAGLPALPPLVFEPAQAALQVVLYPMGNARGPGEPLEVLIHQIQPGLPLLVFGISDGAPGEPLLAQLRTMLALDEDLETFYALCDRDKELFWVREKDAGRRLRSPTVFEDLVKCLLRARAAPSRVRPIVTALCRGLGATTNLRRSAFPTAQAIATAKPRFFEREVEVGRLATPLRALAECCASGALYPESLRRPPRRYSDFLDDEARFDDVIGEELEWQFRIERLLSRLPGFGPRARDLMLPILGCYDGLALDAATLRAWQLRARSARSKKAAAKSSEKSPAAAMARRVAPYSLYGGLAQRLLLRGDGV
jgi:hypothetical protein